LKATLSAEWQAEQETLRRSIEKHRSGGEVYFVEGAKLLEFACRSQELSSNQSAKEQRNLLDF